MIRKIMAFLILRRLAARKLRVSGNHEMDKKHVAKLGELAAVSVKAMYQQLKQPSSQENAQMLSELRALRKQSEIDAKKLSDSIATLDANQSDRHHDGSAVINYEWVLGQYLNVLMEPNNASLTFKFHLTQALADVRRCREAGFLGLENGRMLSVGTLVICDVVMQDYCDRLAESPDVLTDEFKAKLLEASSEIKNLREQTLTGFSHDLKQVPQEDGPSSLFSVIGRRCN